MFFSKVIFLKTYQNHHTNIVISETICSSILRLIYQSIIKRNIIEDIIKAALSYQEIKTSGMIINYNKDPRKKCYSNLVNNYLPAKDDFKKNTHKKASTAHVNKKLDLKKGSDTRTPYYLEAGLRKVYPYYYTYATPIKKRWVGEKVLDIFTKEFRAFPTAEYERCIRSGTLTVNNQKVDPDYRLKHSDIIGKTIHRHEDPVINKPITIIHKDENIVIINKPSSIPVYPCGRYRFNTVTFIIANEYNLNNVCPIHRLDKQTSGLLLLGRNTKMSSELSNQFQNRLVHKEYICRVKGKFPKGEIVCHQPLKVLKNKISVCKVSPDGKDSLTIFKRVTYNTKSNTSVVLCYPKTGRMHQIRVHLQYLGYPIVNDSKYNNVVVDTLRLNDIGEKSDEQIVSHTEATNKIKEVNKHAHDFKNYCENSFDIQLSSTSTTKQIVHPQTGRDLTFDPDCYQCSVQYQDPRPQDMLIYLHAWKYNGPGWEYKTPLPEWAHAEWLE